MDSLTTRSTRNVTKSPKAAATGVAMLSGFTPYFVLNTMTELIKTPKIRLLMEAVSVLLLIISILS
jgi:hypothetical protein